MGLFLSSEFLFFSAFFEIFFLPSIYQRQLTIPCMLHFCQLILCFLTLCIWLLSDFLCNTALPPYIGIKLEDIDFKYEDSDFEPSPAPRHPNRRLTINYKESELTIYLLNWYKIVGLWIKKEGSELLLGTNTGQALCFTFGVLRTGLSSPYTHPLGAETRGPRGRA